MDAGTARAAPDASFGLPTGAGLGNAVGLAAGRHAVLARAGWDVEARGLYDAPPITVVIGEEAHATLLTALQYLGLGRDRVIRIPTDDQGRMSAPEAAAVILRDRGTDDRGGQAGNVNSGAFDPVGPIADALATRPNTWLHIDGAFGLWAAASPRLRHLVEGVERADSWATDAHKWLNVGYDCGFVAVRDPAAHRAAMATSASYLMRGEDRENWEWVLDSSRRARGFPLYAAIRSLGRDGVQALVERCCDLAATLADRLRGGDGSRSSTTSSSTRSSSASTRASVATRTPTRGRSSIASRPMARPGWAARPGTAWTRCGSASRTGRPARPISSVRRPRSCAALQTPDQAGTPMDGAGAVRAGASARSTGRSQVVTARTTIPTPAPMKSVVRPDSATAPATA